jgi:oligosaccharide reducing-end xylanase
MTPIERGGRELTEGAAFTDRYPNLFVELLGVGEQEVRRKIASCFAQLFHGDPADQTIYYEWGPDMAYVYDACNGDVRSEGLSYAMMVAVQLDAQAEFDRLWRFARTHSLHAGGPWKGYFAWALEVPGPYPCAPVVKEETSAPDGEAWYATSLLFAANRWGRAGTTLDYRADAQAILNAMLHTADRPADERTCTLHSETLVVGNMFDPATLLVAFVPAGPYAAFTDPSYQLPHFYELWAAWADQNQDFWRQAAAASRAFLRTAANSETGLAPDYADFDGRPHEAGPHAHFQYDAFRVGANLGVDHLWFRRDPWQVEQADRLLGFFHQKGPDYPALWTLSGEPLNTGHGVGLTGTNAALALAASDAALRREFVQALWDASLPTGTYRYYDGILYLLGLLQVGGSFRVYHPGGRPAGSRGGTALSERDPPSPSSLAPRSGGEGTRLTSGRNK